MASEKKNKFRNIPVQETDLIEEKEGVKFEINRQHDIEEDPFLPKKNTVKKNKVKKVVVEEEEEETEVETTPKPKVKKKEKVAKVTISDRIQKVVSVYQNERTQKIIGLTLILSASYLCIAFISYFFTWDVDQDKVMGSFSDLFSTETKVTNWLGKLGALVSHQFMHKWFGVSSFLFVPVLAMYGFQKLLNRSFVKPQAFNAKWLFLMVWSSLTLAFIFHDKLFFLGGGFGYILNQQISNYVGTVGLLALLGFSMLTFL
ncbi:MAG TPA: DNA translocase FtsK 4TM domain-containing protein, partial [Bacteroidia bacterium]|nr:DNA translocase FtsK 4TM domain-containing protein [Bacteroidia bacterium]